jgi:hypothetical protein
MKTQTGEELDMVIMDWEGSTCFYSRVKTQQPFNSAARLEAQDAQGQYFLSIQDSQFRLVTQKQWILAIKDETADYIQASSEQAFVVLAKTAAAASPLFIGSMKGLFANQCNS